VAKCMEISERESMSNNPLQSPLEKALRVYSFLLYIT